MENGTGASFGAILRNIRKARKLTVPMVAAMAGIAANTLYNAESGKFRIFSRARLDKIMDGMSLTPSERRLLVERYDLTEESPFTASQRERWAANKARNADVRDAAALRAEIEVLRVRVRETERLRAALAYLMQSLLAERRAFDPDQPIDAGIVLGCQCSRAEVTEELLERCAFCCAMRALGLGEWSDEAALVELDAMPIPNDQRFESTGSTQVVDNDFG